MIEMHRPTPMSAFVQRVWPRIETDQPGETFLAGKWIAFPWLCRVLSLGILLLNAYRIKWLTVVFVFVYFALDVGLHWVLKYASHGRRRIAYPMALCACFTLFSLIATMFWQGIIEATYSARQLADDEYSNKYEQFRRERMAYESWAASQEEINASREERQIRKEQAREKAEKQAAVRTRLALSLARRTGQTVPIESGNSGIAEEQGNTEQGEPRKAPLEPKAPEETAAQFLARWLFWMKVVQFGDLGWVALGLSWLLFASIELNIRDRPRVTGELPSNLPVNVSPSLPALDVETVLSEVRLVPQKSGEGEVSPTEMGSITEFPEGDIEPALIENETGWQADILIQANNLQSGETVSPEFRAAISAIVSQKIAEREFWAAIPLPTQDISTGETMAPGVISNSLPEGTLEGDSEGTYTICGGDYKLKQKRKNDKPMGFDLRLAHPTGGQRRDVCYVNQTLGLEILRSDTPRQRQIVDRLRKEKEPQIRLVANTK